MALVLKGKTGRNGDIKRFDVVRVQDGATHEVLTGIDAGTYHVLGGDNTVTEATVGYREVQDITVGGNTTTL